MHEFTKCEACSNIETVKTYVTTTIELFQTEFAIKVQHADVIDSLTMTEVDSINLMSELTGSLEANIIFSFERPLAKKVLDSFPYIEYEPEMEEEMIIETGGEFLNIVIGHAMRNLQSNMSLNFSPPICISNDMTTYCGQEKEVCTIKLTLDDGQMLIVFSTPKKEL